MVETINNISTLLWSLISIIGGIILLWALWQIIQIVRNLREYGLDYIGLLRGEIYKAAEQNKITILKPSQKKSHIYTLLFDENDEKK